MSKIRFYFLAAIFLIIPVVYAWLYIPYLDSNLADIVHPILFHINSFLSSVIQYISSTQLIQHFFPNGFNEIRWSGFESVKVLLFFIFLIGAVVSFVAEYITTQKKFTISRTFLLSSLIVFTWSVSSYFLNRHINPYFFTGNQEKTHGLIFYIGLFFLFWLVRSLKTSEQKHLFHISFIGFALVILYAFFQRFGLDPLILAYHSRLDPWRIFSTLGNPNYLAGYVLLMLPLLRVYHFDGEVSWQEHLWEVGVWTVSGFIIYWTGSYLAWMVFAGYVGYTILAHILPQGPYRKYFWLAITVSVFIFVLSIWFGYHDAILEAQKMKGFIARWYLWKTGFSALTYDRSHILFGYGPDGFLSVSEYFRHPLLSFYEDPAYRIDRSHNVFLDFAIHFGVPVFFLVLWLIFKYFKHLSHEKKIALGLFALYFSFNIPVLVHFLIVVQILASAKNKS